VSAVDEITSAVRSALCGSLEVTSVPIGYAVNTGFMLPDGDRLSFYVVPEDDGRYRLEDDGTTLPNAVAAGLDLGSPVRDGLLRSILAQEGIRYDDDYLLRSPAVEEHQLGATALSLISALIRTRDLSLLNRENVAASFAEDVKHELEGRLPRGLIIEEALRASDSGGPDFVIRRPGTGIKVARIYAANGDLKLMDALVDFQDSGSGDSPVIAVVDRRRGRVTERRFNTATNKGLPMAVVDGINTDWARRITQIVTG